MNTNQNDIEKRLWAIADELRANSRLRVSDYSPLVLGLIFLRYADHKFAEATKEFSARTPTGTRRGKTISKEEYQEQGVPYLTEEARFQHLAALPESEDIARAITNAMRTIEAGKRTA